MFFPGKTYSVLELVMFKEFNRLRFYFRSNLKEMGNKHGIPLVLVSRKAQSPILVLIIIAD